MFFSNDDDFRNSKRKLPFRSLFYWMFHIRKLSCYQPGTSIEKRLFFVDKNNSKRQESKEKMENTCGRLQMDYANIELLFHFVSLFFVSVFLRFILRAWKKKQMRKSGQNWNKKFHRPFGLCDRWFCVLFSALEFILCTLFRESAKIEKIIILISWAKKLY